jgi:hypothetical protein
VLRALLAETITNAKGHMEKTIREQLCDYLESIKRWNPDGWYEWLYQNADHVDSSGGTLSHLDGMSCIQTGDGTIIFENGVFWHGDTFPKLPKVPSHD